MVEPPSLSRRQSSQGCGPLILISALRGNYILDTSFRRRSTLSPSQPSVHREIRPNPYLEKKIYISRKSKETSMGPITGPPNITHGKCFITNKCTTFRTMSSNNQLDPIHDPLGGFIHLGLRMGTGLFIFLEYARTGAEVTPSM